MLRHDSSFCKSFCLNTTALDILNILMYVRKKKKKKNLRLRRQVVPLVGAAWVGAAAFQQYKFESFTFLSWLISCSISLCYCLMLGESKFPDFTHWEINTQNHHLPPHSYRWKPLHQNLIWKQNRYRLLPIKSSVNLMKLFWELASDWRGGGTHNAGGYYLKILCLRKWLWVLVRDRLTPTVSTSS